MLWLNCVRQIFIHTIFCSFPLLLVYVLVQGYLYVIVAVRISNALRNVRIAIQVVALAIVDILLIYLCCLFLLFFPLV